FGLISVAGEPFVIEYNCRMGDPETEVVIPRIKSDFVEILDDLVNNRIKDQVLKISDQSAATIMMVSGGYPGDFSKNKIITRLNDVASSLVFHSGTAMDGDNLVTNGGRVLAVTTLSNDHKTAVKISLDNADKICFDGKYYRRDIGFDL
ncbi:MAG: phosphoribosylamine--glycine ligase, partial [Saprospiraceae bacterium]|nr:phosphoribosylamine--glycine ligase [Saprospiraceae bacterium]